MCDLFAVSPRHTQVSFREFAPALICYIGYYRLDQTEFKLHCKDSVEQPPDSRWQSLHCPVTWSPSVNAEYQNSQRIV
ncbi:hypothetical protein LMG29739_04123 [Paraburkholderia solisilvae]|uniref:Uncharacterized protein n=1 Tax=Paraburkholderia solisilvae TaxID=624376 RepID=A0A6J5EAF5_9BURK|nr:hypothetical protein LMG29739_04123 [Paraburkholderia solisilvae]